MKETRYIKLHLPQSWNQCTTEELEHIASAIIEEQARIGRYHIFNWERVKVNIVIAINGLSVESEERRAESEESGFLVRRGKEEPWPISTGQLCSLCEILSWLNDEKASKVIFQFPYPTLDVRCKREEGRAISHHPSSIIHLQGPPPLLDGYTWQEYRWLTDWMQEYMRCANALVQGKTADVRSKSQAALATARNEFLAVLFKPAGKPTDTTAAEHTSAISHLTSDIFESFSPIKWQVILFWWSSLMQQLAQKFPKVFKQQPLERKRGRHQQKPDTPWDFYNRVTASVQKYIGGLSAQDVDNQPYGVVLQQLEMMADETAEMEKMKKKK